MRTSFAIIGALATLCLPAQAEDIAGFYAGKTIRIIVGIGVGSGFDINVAQLCYIEQSRLEGTNMSRTATIRARVEPELKRGAEAVFKKMGITSSEAINLFLAQVKLTKGLPFPLRVPNKETRRAINEARARKNLETFNSVSEWAKKVRSL